MNEMADKVLDVDGSKWSLLFDGKGNVTAVCHELILTVSGDSMEDLLQAIRETLRFVEEEP